MTTRSTTSVLYDWVYRKDKIVKNHIELVGNHTLFVEGATDRITAAQLLEENSNETPIGLMFAGAGTLALKTGPHQILNVPYRKVRLDDPHVVVQNMMLEAEGTALSGVGIGLPDDMVRLHSAWKAAVSGMTYNWNTFLKQYLGDLERLGSLFLDHLDLARIDGLMAQVITDPRIGEDEVGASLTLAKKLHKALIAAGHDELKDAGHLDRMIVLLQRYPVVSKTGGRWVKLRVIKGAPADKILVNARAWKELHDGDEDGDEGYIGIVPDRKAKFGEVERLPDYPELKPLIREDVPEKKSGDPVQTVMNMRARSIIGSQHTFFHGIARALAVRCEREGGKSAFERAVRGVFDLYHPMAEGVFDKRKDEGGADDFNNLVLAMEEHLDGKTVTTEPFKRFLSDEQFPKFEAVLKAVGGSTRLARGTAYGRYLMTANSGPAKTAVCAFLMDTLSNMGIDAKKMLPALQADALGEKIIPVQMPKESSTRSKKKEEIKLNVGEIETIKDVFESVRLGDRPVLKIVGMDEHTDGSIAVNVRLIPAWDHTQKSVVIQIDWPNVKRVPGLHSDEKHRLIKMEGPTTRMFCPILKMVNDKIILVDFHLWFATAIKDAIESLIERMGSITKEKLQSHMERHMRTALRSLIVLNDKDKDAATREMLIRMFEYRVEVEKGTLSGELADFEKVLTKLNAMGFDVVTTSKNHPGRIVTKSWNGAPRWLWAINPFAGDLDLKRRVEPREVRMGLEFFNPIAPPLTTKGSKTPATLAKVITTLNVAVMDLEELNIFQGSDGKLFCFDTLLVTASGVEKLKLKKLPRHASNTEQKDKIVKSLAEEGFTKIKVEENVESAGNGLSHIAYDIVAMKEEGIEDIGKIKACVGPIKGVMNPVPFRLFKVNEDGSRVEIDLIVPHDTIIRKHGVAAVNYMMAANAGMTEIDPDNQPELEVKKSKIELEDGTELGEFIAGPLPFFRPVQTGRSTMDIRTGEHGIKVHTHTMIMTGGVKFNTPEWVLEDFAQILNTRTEVKTLMAARELAAEVEEAPLPEYAEA